MSFGFEPVAVDPVENAAYGYDAHGDFTALFKRTLDGSSTSTLVLGRDDTDVDSLLRIGRKQRIIGASFIKEKRSVQYFDPVMGKLAAALAKALPNHPEISIFDASADENKLVLLASSDVDPGTFYIYDKTTHGLADLLPVRPEMAGVAMGEMKSVQYPAADGTMIPGYLTLPPGSSGKDIPAIVMPHGGPSARDEWGFDWLVQFYASRGYAVLQPNYRGSSGMGKKWQNGNAVKAWKLAISDVNDAGRYLLSSGIAAKGKLAIVGWSYGGYAALQTSVLDPDLFKAIVAVAPVTDWGKMREYQSSEEDFIGQGPHIEEGSPARHAEMFKAPIMIFHGNKDQNVDIAQSRLMNSKLQSAGKSVVYTEFPGLDHQLDDTAARTKLLDMSDRFLREKLGL